MAFIKISTRRTYNSSSQAAVSTCQCTPVVGHHLRFCDPSTEGGRRLKKDSFPTSLGELRQARTKYRTQTMSYRSVTTKTFQNLPVACYRPKASAKNHISCFHAEGISESSAIKNLGNISSRRHFSRCPTPGHWIQRHIRDRYVIRAQSDMYRSRAAYKLRQMDDQFGIFRKNQVVLDLGCWSGGWSQVAVERTVLAGGGSQTTLSRDPDEPEEINTAKVIGVDLLHIDTIDHHTFIQGDVTQTSTLDKVVEAIGPAQKADVILSDLCPPLSGQKQDDHLNSTELCLAATDVMERVLRPQSTKTTTSGNTWFICKTFYGPETSNLRAYLKSRFKLVRSTKPPASRDESREMYLICAGFVGRAELGEEVGYQWARRQENTGWMN